uniref:Lipase n=3 Tax=Cacopsylla melanoneura TaxID=428564 RepID=A0A8D9AWW0_9HEMI
MAGTRQCKSSICVLILAFLFRAKAASTTEEKIRQHGYPVETHKIVTEDGYVLVLERIPHNRQSTEVGPPVLLLHGLFSISISFTFNNSSLGYILSDAGYDVWLCNNRGVGPSRKHTHLTDNDTRYWDFSYHEIGYNDFPASMDYILAQTGRKKLKVIGYSLGAAVALIGLSERADYNEKVDKLILMGPTSRMKYYGRPLDTIKSLGSFLIKVIDQFQLEYFPIPKNPEPWFELGRSICSEVRYMHRCKQLLDLAQGRVTPITDKMLLDVMANYPHPMSTKILKHYLQSMTGKFNQYDYGPSINMAKYSSRVPPKYNLSQIQTPTIVISSDGDTLVPPKDVGWLINELPNVVDTYNIPSQAFGHLSFVIHPDVKNLLNDYVVAFLI